MKIKRIYVYVFLEVFEGVWEEVEIFFIIERVIIILFNIDWEVWEEIGVFLILLDVIGGLIESFLVEIEVFYFINCNIVWNFVVLYYVNNMSFCGNIRYISLMLEFNFFYIIEIF